ncbi:hypothetical protein CFC21_003736 [Triticum aestivum]|uniref:Uncharacterized protein n=1 Tax=Triticum aestivum TaxID=4565 RepID=A0A3B5Y665_WHEAT|nr:uncharacterized protein At1g15400-like [Triticum aestivum]KAF6985930.1 hypothetical protein CFC21_003736 [Triticum aestivum]
MAGLQRSSGTFRRSGSSGMVWDGDSHLSGEIKPVRVERSRSTGHAGYRASAGRVSLALDPPSPRVAVCGFCACFRGGKSKAAKKSNGGKAKAAKPKARTAAGSPPRPKARRASG